MAVAVAGGRGRWPVAVAGGGHEKVYCEKPMPGLDQFKAKVSFL